MREQIIAAIRGLAAEIGRPPGMRLFETRTGMAQHAWRGRYWARWGDALIEAGFQPNAWTPRPEPEALLEPLAAAVRRFGRLPTGPELSLYRRTYPAPSPHTLRSRFGAQAELIERLRAWAQASPDRADVAALLPPAGAPAARTRRRERAEGVLRLFRCRESYRFVPTGEADDRRTWPPVALPASATQEHAIRTDDVAGVEAYWRRRFAPRRIDPEWFALTPDDVAAFQRWKQI